MSEPQTLLIQLPLHPGCGFEPTGNIPLAPARLAAAAGLPLDSVVPGELCDSLSDSEILSMVTARGPRVVVFTLYMWNAERSAWLAAEIRKALPGVFVLGGGPEVTQDNLWLRESGAFNLLVEGEGESFATNLGNVPQLLKLAETLSGFTSTGKCTFLPDHWPDPYFTGHLEGSGDLPAHIETVRGCPHHCAYCAYRRICPQPRVSPAAAVLRNLKRHRGAGRSEFVFLDPTFNGRSDLAGLLAGMRGMGLSCFAEVRAGLANLDPSALAVAGFHSVEVGLQTTNRRVLQAMGRHDDPGRTLMGAVELKNAGVEPIVDLIFGLPGDSPERILEAGERLVSLGLGKSVQAFYLSVLPGTLLREMADGIGLEFMDRPPYWVTGLPGLTLDHLACARDELGSVLGFDLDMEPRPVLCRDWPHTTLLDLDSPFEPVFSGRHSVLRVRGERLWERRHSIISAAEKRFRTDPYCVLDVVIEASGAFPVDLPALVSAITRPRDYIDRTASVLGRQGRLRTTVIAAFDADPGWLSACSQESLVVVPWNRPGQVPSDLLEHDIGLLIEGFPELSALAETFSAFSEQLFFSEMRMERLWCQEVLDLG
ncbi:MAG: radical SAM protein [Candidatus Fermentibacteraceae bacterium]